MMKKINTYLPLLIVSALLFFGFSAFVYAGMTVDEVAPIYNGRYANVTGQNQFYDVVFDGEGEAAVGAKLTFQNYGKEDIKEITLEIPGRSIRLISAVEETRQRNIQCSKYDTICPYKELSNDELLKECGNKGVQYKCVPDFEFLPDCTAKKYQCVEWRSYNNYTPVYSILEPKEDIGSDAVKYSFALPVAISSSQSASIMLYYKVEGYAEKSSGVFKFKFNTLKVGYDVNRIRVAVNVQEGFHLKGGKARTSYRPNVRSAFQGVADIGASPAEVQSLSNYSNRITHIAGYVKQTSGQDPWESFVVEGKYSESRFRLYWKGILAGAAVGLLLLIMIVFFVKRMIKKIKARKKISAQDTSNVFQNSKVILVKAVIVGSGSGFGVIIISVISIAVFYLIGEYAVYPFDSIFMLLVFLVSLLVIVALSFGTAIWIGFKYGSSFGIWAFVSNIIIVIVLSIIIAVIWFLFDVSFAIVEPIFY